MSVRKSDDLERLRANLRLRPDDTDMREELCAILIERADWLAALSNSLFMVQRHPERAFGHLSAARARAELGRHGQAEASLLAAQGCGDYREVMERESDLFGGIAYAIAKVEARKRRPETDEFEDSPRIAIGELSTRDKGEHAFFIYAYRAPSLEGEAARKAVAFAEALADEVLDVDPLDVNALRASAGIKIDAGRFEEALARIQCAFQQSADFLDARFLVAQIHLKQGEYAAAIPHLEAVASAWPTFSSASADLERARDRVAPFSWRRLILRIARYARGWSRSAWRLILMRKSASSDTDPTNLDR